MPEAAPLDEPRRPVALTMRAARSFFGCETEGIFRGMSAVVGITGGVDSTGGIGIGVGSIAGAGGVKAVSAGAAGFSRAGCRGESSDTNALSAGETDTLIPPLL